MARVYSWQINEAPKTYAYIVNPNNTEIAYIGIELTGTNLQKVIDWASTCTDTQYESQFNKVKALCESSGYEVTFETVEAYMNVRSSCDNLRGPSGRGIQHITRVGIDSSTNTDTYAIYYDDGTYDTFTVQNGRDGRNGDDGKPGAPGDTGVSYRTIMAYTSGVDANGNEIEVQTPKPTEGSHDFITNTTVYPDGWQASDSNLTPPIWMSSRTFATIDSATDKTWTPPIQITGDNGQPGADGISTEFIYKRSDVRPSNVSTLPSKDENDFVPDGWSDSPEGVDETNHKEWYCLRKKKDNKWGKWEGPFIWSQYGVNGQDGDGVQYIYIKTKTGQPPANPTPLDWETDKDYQDKDSEWIPPIETLYTNISGKSIKLIPEQDGDTKAGIWADDPIPVSINYQYQWVSSRKYRMDNVKKRKIWTTYSDPALWNKFGEDGKSGTVIRKLYALSTSTDNPPDLPNSTSFTGNWGTGFPRDYKSGVNVVWGTEAEIYISTNEFVMGYKKISITSENGAVIVPNGVNEMNTEDVDVLPDEKRDKQYLRFNGHYYEWSGGWCDAYLVTGVKGQPGDPVSYNTYYFHYGSTDSPPDSPRNTDINNIKDKTFTDQNNNTWEDFPNTKDGRIDNETNRWYQCCGSVGSDQIVKEWGSVYPCNGKDGEILPGVYFEMRFGTGLNDIPPTVDFDIDDPDDIRYPKLYDENDNQCGWYTTSHELLVPSGGHMYEIWAKIDSATNTVIPEGGVYWNGPIRISGERGEQGIPGPAGLKGVSGIPGVSINTMFVLGTSNKHFAKKQITEGEDGNTKDTASKEVMEGLGWFDNKNIPYSDCIDMYDNITEDKLKGNEGRVIRLYNTTKLNSFEGDVTTTTHYYYNTKLVSYKTEELTELGLEKFGDIPGLYQIKDFDDETDGIYVWCVQGDDVWELGKENGYVKVEGIIADYDNTIKLNHLPTKKEDFEDYTGKTYKYAVYYGHCYEWLQRRNTSVAVSATIMIDKKVKEVTQIPTEEDTNFDYILKTKEENGVVTKENYYKWAALDGAEIKHKKVTIDWGDPFRLQGTNGLRGLTGHRGQVVYPMGIYSHNEVYRTTAEKAPYVYDPDDGMFYVYNITTIPWLGYRPDDFLTIMIHPDDVNADNTHSLKEGEPFPTDKQSNKPYLYDKYGVKGPKAYYKWNDETETYVRVSKYKYSLSGNSMAESDWIPQQEQTPSTNYANATNNNETPAWVRFESFEALYTSIGIIENGMIGSAVYNNEFMFSQQGIDRDGNVSNYAQGGMGFLSAYTYDNASKQWKDENNNPIENSHDINPYKIGTDGKAIHKFRPNVCINFATGQMWTACGKCFHDYNGAGYLADQAIKWGWNNEQFEVQIGYEGQNGITIGSGVNGFKIGLLDTYKEETDKKIKTKTETWYGEDIPSLNWDSENERLEHDGDIWYCTVKKEINEDDRNKPGGNQNYREDATYRWDYKTEDSRQNWVEINVPAYIFDRFDGKSTIFVEKPITDDDKDNYLYHKNDLWLLEVDYKADILNEVKIEENKDNQNKLKTKAELAKPGTIWVANKEKEYDNSKTDKGFSWLDWDKKGTELDNWVKDVYQDSINNIKEQVDKKAETWYQDTDPFVWKTKNDADMHIGDMWYNTTNNFTYILHDKKVDSTNDLSKNIVHEITEYNGTTNETVFYTWVSSSIPSSIFDWFDGKSTIFVIKPDEDKDEDGYLYRVGDLWLTLDYEPADDIEKDEADKAGIKQNGIYRSTKDRKPLPESPTIDDTFGFHIEDWEPASNYTDDTLAQIAFERFEAMAEDGYISPEERKILRKETANIKTEYRNLKTQAEGEGYKFNDVNSKYNSVYNEFIIAYNEDNNIKNRVSLLTVINYFTTESNSIKNTKSEYYNCIEIDVENSKGEIIPKTKYNDILVYYQAKDKLLNAFTEYANDTAQEASATASELQIGVNNITSTVKRMSIENLLNGTEFNEHDISYSTDTVFVCNTHKTGGKYTIYENDKELNGHNYVSVNALIAKVDESNCVDIWQKLNEPGASQTFWKIKSKTEYTLHCKYRTTVNKDNDEYIKTINEGKVYNPGALYITGSNPTYIKVNEVEKNSLPSDLCTYLENTENVWKDMVIKFTTGTITNSNDQSNAFYIKTIVGSKVDIALLKLEEGHTPTPWRKTQDDISSTIKQTADSITSTVNSIGNSLSEIEQTADRISLSVDSLKGDLGKTGIDITNHKITIKGDVLFENEKTYFNDTVVIGKDGGFNARKATFENVIIKGSLASPFVLDDDKKDIDIYHDNISYKAEEKLGTKIFSKNLKWDLSQSGRRVTVVNYKWDNILYYGTANLHTPSYFDITNSGIWGRLDDKEIEVVDDDLSKTKELYEIYHTSLNIPQPLEGQFNKYVTEFKFKIPDELLKNKNPNDIVIKIRINSSYSGTLTSDPYEINVFTPIQNKAHDFILSSNKNTNISLKLERNEFNESENEITIKLTQKYIIGNTLGNTIWIQKPTDKKSTVFFYENGIEKQSIDISRELVTLLGYGDTKRFYGWIVVDRVDVNTNYLYGKNFKCLAYGCIHITNNAFDTTKTYCSTFDGTPITIYNMYNKYKDDAYYGKYRIEFDESWDKTLPYCIVIATGLNGGDDDEGRNVTVTPYTNFSKEPTKGIEFLTTGSDTDPVIDSGFNFIMFNYLDFPTFKVT